MSSLANKISEITGAAFAALGLPAELGLVRVSDRPDLAQFQCNGAMAAAKKAGKNPREVAQLIIDYLYGAHWQAQDIVPAANPPESKHKYFSKLEIAGPGFININVTDEVINAHLAEVAASKTLGVPDTGKAAEVILDYGGPNIAKAMHVGHLRSSIIGDALRRMYGFAGFTAIGDVHMGDWGTPMGMILSELEAMNFSGEITMELLAEIYPKAAQDCKDSEERMERARAATKKLQDGDAAYTKRWREFIDVSIAGMKKNFDALGVHFDEWKGEADAHPYIEKMVADFKAKGWAQESDGALIVAVSQEGDKKEVPPLILLKSDGAVLYGTTDMATIIDRLHAHKPVKIIYVVDQRQSLHFEQVFRAVKIGGIVGEAPELIFAGFGTMNGTDGKPFKTRAGGVMKLEDLIAMGIEKAQARLAEAEIASDLGAEARADITNKVALAAIKFADLQNQRQSDYVFDLDRMTSFEGKTGPYLLYQVVRIKSLLRKAEEQGFKVGGDIQVSDGDRELGLLLAEFPDHFQNALQNHTPHVLCDYAYKLAQAFSSFYGNCHILSEADENVRTSRLALCARTAAQIELVLSLLGIEVPKRM